MIAPPVPAVVGLLLPGYEIKQQGGRLTDTALKIYCTSLTLQTGILLFEDVYPVKTLGKLIDIPYRFLSMYGRMYNVP